MLTITTTESGAVAPFKFNDHLIRVVTDENGEPLFVGKDVCDALKYANASKAFSDHCKGVTRRYPLLTDGGTQEMRVLAEPDVLRLIVSCSLPAAQAFERLVFEEILPTIRKTGKYSTAPALPQSFAAALRLAADQQDTIAAQAEQLAAAAPKVEFADKYADSTGLKGFREAAKALNVNENDFRQFLADEKIMYRLNGAWAPYANHQAAGRLAVKVGTSTRNGHAFNSAKFTPKGILWAAGELARWQLAQRERQEVAHA